MWQNPPPTPQPPIHARLQEAGRGTPLRGGPCGTPVPESPSPFADPSALARGRVRRRAAERCASGAFRPGAGRGFGDWGMGRRRCWAGLALPPRGLGPTLHAMRAGSTPPAPASLPSSATLLLRTPTAGVQGCGAEAGSDGALRFLSKRVQRPRSAEATAVELRPSLAAPLAEIESCLAAAVELGHAASLLVLGPRQSGKTLLVERALRGLCARHNPGAGADPRVGVVRLSGWAHAEERTAFRETALQLCECAPSGGDGLGAGHFEGGGWRKDPSLVACNVELPCSSRPAAEGVAWVDWIHLLHRLDLSCGSPPHLRLSCFPQHI